MKKNSYYMILAIFLVSLNLRLGISSISPILENIKYDLDLSNGTVSLLTSIPVICMGFFAFFAATVSSRFGLERTIAFCLVLIGLATAFRAWTNSAWTLLLTAFAVGIGIAIAGPLISGYIKEKFPNRIGMMIGVYSVAMGIGSSLSSGLMIPLQEQLDGSWQLALASWSIFAVIAFLFWYPILKDNKTMANSAGSVIRIPFRNRKVWLFTLIFGLQSGMFYCISTWLAPIAQTLGFTREQSGALITLFTLTTMAFSFLIPSLADVFRKEKAWLMGSTAFVLMGLLCFIFELTNPWVATIFVGIGLGGLFPLALVLPLNAVSSSSEASAWTSMMQGFGYMLGGIIPVAAGLLRDFITYDKQVFVLMVGLCLILFAILFSWKDKRVSA